MTKLDKLSLAEFVAELGSSSPAPGGGSTAALAGALACALTGMVASISLKKSEDSVVQKKLKDIFNASKAARVELLKLINKDAIAFNKILKSYKLPKGTDAEKQARSVAIQSATCHAAEVPLLIAELGLEALNRVKDLITISSPQTITDLGVAGLMSHAAITGGVWNVWINLGSIVDEAFVSEITDKLEMIIEQMHYLWPEVREAVENKI
jgi:formiminotetrahydrofolate cyclodeaminase